MLYRYLLIPLFILLNTSFVYSQQTIVLNDQTNDKILNENCYVYQFKGAGINAIKLVVNDSSNFKKNESFQEINYGFNSHGRWCRFTIKNKSATNHWVLKIQQARVDSTQLFIKRNHKLETYPLTGRFQKIDNRPIHSTAYGYKIAIQPGETITGYLYTEREFGRHAAILRLQQESYFINYENLYELSISFICGIIILAALIGLILYFFLSDKIYFYYSIYCISFCILILVNSGFIHAFYNDLQYQQVINTFSTIIYYWHVGWHILFTVVLLNTKNDRHKLFFKIGFFSGTVFCAIALALLIIPVPDAIRSFINHSSYYIVFYADVFILYTITIHINKNKPLVYLYLAGFLVTLIAASLLKLADLQLIDGINQITDIYYFIPLIEILFMALALGYHFSGTLKDRFKIQLDLNKVQQKVITIQEDERKRIAQDLHDDVSNSLAAVRNMALQNSDNISIGKEIQNIILNIRNISHNLMPVDFQEYNLQEILRHTVNKFKDALVKFDYQQTGNAIKLNSFTELVIYRIVNELMGNVIKHACATNVLIQLLYQQDSLIVTVEDDGIGFNTTDISGNGMGLKNVELRAVCIHSKITFESDAKGTLIILEIPYKKNGDED